MKQLTQPATGTAANSSNDPTPEMARELAGYLSVHAAAGDGRVMRVVASSPRRVVVRGDVDGRTFYSLLWQPASAVYQMGMIPEAGRRAELAGVLS